MPRFVVAIVLWTLASIASAFADSGDLKPGPGDQPTVAPIIIPDVRPPTEEQDPSGLTTRTIPGKWFEPLLPETDAEPNYPDYDKKDDFQKARAQLAAGQYRRALATANRLRNADPAALAIVKAKALAALGRSDKALSTLSDPPIIDQPAVQIERAQILADIERYPEAIELLNKILIAHSSSIPGHFLLGWCHEQSGDVPGAKSAYQWFIDPPQQFIQQWQGHARTFENASDVVTIGRALDRWATLTGAYEDNRQLHDVILSMFVRSYNVIDTEYWPAHVAAAEYFLSHDDAEEATGELRLALHGNPHDARAITLMGQIALKQFNFDGADKAAEELRNVDPQSFAADLLEARNFLQQRRPKDAMHPLNEALSKRPKDIEALGLLAAAESLQLHDDKAADILKQADLIAPTQAVAYYEMAEQLGAMRQYPRAAEMYKKAILRAPWWNDARNGLGLLMTQSGDEDAARTILEAARTLDPFNVRTTNYLRLLDMMDKFARKESAHFIVMYDAKLDPVVPEYFSDYLESAYKDVTSDFHYEPPVKTLIEVFPSHDAFSVRTTGAPWIATVGASTGRVIALVSPRNFYGAGGPFNFSQVLRHELTHTVTLGMTDNRIAHWFTEGLAVQEEHSPLQWEWVPMLFGAVKNDTLFDLDHLTWAFVRPKKPSDRQLAYAESFWICQYVTETYGHQALLDMCDGFKAGKDQDEIFSSVLKKPTPVFFDEFKAWTRKQTATWGYDKQTDEQYDKLRDEAQSLVDDGKYDEAIQRWEQIAALRPMDSMPHHRLAGLYLHQGNTDKAIEQLEIISKVELKDNKPVKGLARLYLKKGDTDTALQRAMKAVYIDPYDVGAHELLAQVYEKTGNDVGAQREQRVIGVVKAWLADAKKDADLPVGN